MQPANLQASLLGLSLTIFILEVKKKNNKELVRATELPCRERLAQEKPRTVRKGKSISGLKKNPTKRI